MMKTFSVTADISQLRRNRRLRINYEHRYTPGEVKKQLSAEDVILGRYKYIPPIKLADREKTRIFSVPTRRHGVVASSDHHSLSTTSLPPIHQNDRRTSETSVNSSLSKTIVSSEKGDPLLHSEIPKHPVILIDVHDSAKKDECTNSSDEEIDNGLSVWESSESSKNNDYNMVNNRDDSTDDDDGDDGDDDEADEVGAKNYNGSLSDDASSEYKKYREKLTKERVLTTPDFDTDLDIISESTEKDDSSDISRRRKRKLHKSLKIYQQSCARCHVTPNKSFIRQCGKGTVDLRHRLLTHVEVRPIAIALVNEHRTSFLDISMNPLGPVGTECLAQVLLQNNSIVELNLSSTYPQRAGLESLARSLRHNKTLRRLYLDNNELHPSDGDVIAQLIEDASSLLELHLGNNNLGFGATNRIAQALVLAKGKLKLLNLRYNNIRTDSAAHLAKALAKNKTLQTLDVSWNGFGEAGCKALASSLQQNASLRHLDLKCNRIGLKSLPALIQVITKNTGIHSISVSSNPLSTEGAKALLSALLANKNPTQLTQLDLTGIPVDQEFLVLKESLEATVPIQVLHEATVSLGTSDMSKAATGTFLDNYNPVMTMFEFMKKDNLRVIDMFQFFDIRKRDKLSKSDLAAGFKTLSIPFTKHQIDIIVTALDVDKDGYISLDEMVKGYTKNDKTVKSRRIKASMNKTTDRGLENLWAYLKTLISKRKEDNAKKNAITSQARRNNFLAESNSTTSSSTATTTAATPSVNNANNSNTPAGHSTRKTSVISSTSAVVTPRASNASANNPVLSVGGGEGGGGGSRKTSVVPHRSSIVKKHSVVALLPT